MAGVHIAARDCCTAPFCDENEAPLVINAGAATYDAIKELFGGLVAPKKLSMSGTSVDATRMAMIMLASGAHDFQSPAFAQKFELAAAYCSSFGTSASSVFVPEPDVLDAIRALHRRKQGKGGLISTSPQQDAHIYLNFNEIRLRMQRGIPMDTAK